MQEIDFGLTGKVAIVTGGGAHPEGVGNGSAAAIMLARAGARIALVDIDEVAARRAHDLIVGEGGVAEVHHGDVGTEEDCRRVVTDIARQLGPPAVLVNNVGIAGPPGTAVDVDPDRWDDAMRINVKSMMLMARFVIPYMIEAGGGSIVNMSSAAGLLGGHPAVTYATTKGAITQLTRTMAAQHGLQGIRVNCVAPGMVYTPMVRSRGMTDEMREIRRKRSLMQTEGTAWDVGSAVLFLAGDLARWVTGVTLPVDAGYSAGSHLPSPPRR
ncbi:SDR family oxidoreductase [Baekduia soli]|uniref:SDR family oxidoreductase n=1 Tax=Baekduia soli TaxID=496014 RepID=A0A5B8UAZ1_9ACTN|nr:SDR family oxidoreductase [Baekduia soli]QEC49791.1 SDR family oxidoreductase [Baekduia soli]